MQEEFPVLSAKLRVYQDVGLGRIPIVNVMRSELVIPLQLSRGGIEREDAIREQVIAASLAIVGIRPWVARGPVKSIGLQVIGTGEPCGSATVAHGSSFPCLITGIPLG